MDINSAFPAPYLKAIDLQDREVTVTISHVVMEDVGSNEHKPVAYFEGKEKGVVLNKTNSTNIASMYGPETDNWKGHKIVLYTAFVDFQGRSVKAIRVRPVIPPAPDIAPQTAPQAGTRGGYSNTPPPAAATIDDDEIPF